MQLCREVLDRLWDGRGVHQIQVTALDPQAANSQLELFPEAGMQDEKAASDVIDQVNRRYGEFVLAPARLLNRSDMPNVIAPSWKPFGHRETILKP